MRRVALTLAALVLCALPHAALAETPAVRLELSPATTAPGAPAQVTVTITGKASGAEVQLAVPPGITARRAGTSRNIQIINGRVESNYQHMFQIVGAEPGGYSIGPATVTSGHDTIASNTATLTIAQRRQASSDSTGVFVEVEVDNPTPFVGEQVTYTFRLFRPRTQQFRNFELAKQVTDGAWEEDLDARADTATTVHGQPYLVHTIQTAYFPTRPGQVEISAPTVTYQEIMATRRRTRRNPFDSPFFNDDFFGVFGGRTVQRRADGSTIVLDVRALPHPPEGVAAETHAVGAFTVQATLDTDRVRVGDSVTVTVTLVGTGNLRTVPDFALPTSDAFKAYPDTPSLTVAPHAGAITGTREQRIAIVPQQAGTLAIPSVQLPTFDPHRGEWVILRTDPLTLHVDPGEEQVPMVIAAASATHAAPQPARRIATGLLAAHPRPARITFPSDGERLAAAATATGAPVLFIASLLMRRRATRRAGDPTLVRRQRAGRTARAALTQSPPPTADAIALILSIYVADRVGLPAGVVTGAEAAAIIAAADATLGEHAADIIRAGDASRYGQAANATADTAERAQQLLTALERLSLRQQAAHA